MNPIPRARVSSVLAVLLLALAAGAALPHAQAPPGTTAFEAARVIVGDGSAPIENATIVVTAGRIAAVGPAGKVTVPAGAARVSLAGKTVMPTILDTHVHLSTTRDAADRRPAAPGLFRHQRGDEPGPRPARRPVPGARQPARRRGPLLHRRPWHHHARAGPHRRALLGDHRGRGPQGRAGAGGAQGGLHQDLGRRPRRQVPEDAATDLHRGDRRGAQGQAAGRRPHLQPVGCQGTAQGRHRRLRPRHPRRRRRRRAAGAGRGAARTSC